MRPPRFLLGAALVFWGWQTDQIWMGVLAALGIESAALFKTRWEFSQSDLDRVWNLCVALFLGATIYAFFSADSLHAVGALLRENSMNSRLATLNQSKRSLFQLLQWLPLMFVPIALAQAYAQQPSFELSTFSWWLRRQRHKPGYAARYGIQLTVGYPFFACCLFAASAGNQRTLGFAVGLVALVAWALWLNRSPAFSWVSWGATVLSAVALGFAVYLGMVEAQKLVQRLDEVLLTRWSTGRHLDDKENRTQIGSIGRMKLSGSIVLRVDSKGQSPPPLLREASYNLFHSPYWNASNREFEHVTPEVNLSTWRLRGQSTPAHSAIIAGEFSGGTGLLPLPSGVARLDQLPASGVATNVFGSVRVEDAPGFVQVDAGYERGLCIDAKPVDADLDIPPQERPSIAQINKQLGLRELRPPEAVQALERFFGDHFSYSLDLDPMQRASSNRTALARFLLEHRSGHCEYFATATTLLLRGAGIPARYAVGFAVQEKKGRYYIVRERHAHAWCLAWLNGRWQDIDTTPSVWARQEATEASVLEPLRDLFSRLWFEFSRWRWGHTEWKRYLLWLIVPLLALALGKVLFQRQWSRSRQPSERGAADDSWPGLDSEFYQIEQSLITRGYGRQPGETGAAWLQRLARIPNVPVEGLDALLASHYRLRFHPRGLTADQRVHLRQQTAAWLQRAAEMCE